MALPVTALVRVASQIWVLRPPWTDRTDLDSPDVDVELHDPPVLWSEHDPAPPPTHLHSNWFQDPQTRPYAEDLARQVST